MIRRRRNIFESIKDVYDYNLIGDVLVQQLCTPSRRWKKTDSWVESRNFGFDFENFSLENSKDVDLHFTFEWTNSIKGPVITDYSVKIFGLNDINRMLTLTDNRFISVVRRGVPVWINKHSIDLNVSNIIDYIDDVIDKLSDMDKHDQLKYY